MRRYDSHAFDYGSMLITTTYIRTRPNESQTLTRSESLSRMPHVKTNMRYYDSCAFDYGLAV